MLLLVLLPASLHKERVRRHAATRLRVGVFAATHLLGYLIVLGGMLGWLVVGLVLLQSEKTVLV